MEGPKTLDSNRFSELKEFLNQNLRPNVTWSITDEYPLAFNQQNFENIRVIEKDGQILAHALTKTLLIRSPAGLYKVAAIGSVVTDPKHRNQGYSRTLIESHVKAASEQGCDFAILWTNLYDFYRKLDFELAGSEWSFTLDRDFNPPTDTTWRFMHSSKVAPEALLRVYGQHTVGALRSPEDIRKYLSIPNSNVFTVWDQNNQIQAYAIEGKGADLKGYIHEWGGRVPALLSLFAHMRRALGQNLTVILPQHSKNLFKHLEALGFPIHEGYLGMIRPLDLRNLFFKVLRHARFQGVHDFVIYESHGEYFFGLKDKIYKTNSLQDITKLIFGPFEAQEIYDFDPETAAALKSFLPLPLWIWGWDSV